MNLASLHKKALRENHYAIESATPRKIVDQQYEYQLYPKALSELILKTGEGHLRIIPIGDFDIEADYWVIPFLEVKQLLTPKNLTKGLDRSGVPRRPRWRFHIEPIKGYHHLFVLFPGNRVRLGELDVKSCYGAPLPLSN